MPRHTITARRWCDKSQKPVGPPRVYRIIGRKIGLLWWRPHWLPFVSLPWPAVFLTVE